MSDKTLSQQIKQLQETISDMDRFMKESFNKIENLLGKKK